MIILDFYFLGLTYIIVYVGAIMILFLFVIMMVQIHLMPVTLAVSPRVVLVDKPLSTTSLDLTGQIQSVDTGQADNGQLALLIGEADHGILGSHCRSHIGTGLGTDLALTLVLDSGKTEGPASTNESMALANDVVIRSLTLSNNFISTLRFLLLAFLFI